MISYSSGKQVIITFNDRAETVKWNTKQLQEQSQLIGTYMPWNWFSSITLQLKRNVTSVSMHELAEENHKHYYSIPFVLAMAKIQSSSPKYWSLQRNVIVHEYYFLIP